MIRRCIYALALLLAASATALAQLAVLQGGPFVAGPGTIYTGSGQLDATTVCPGRAIPGGRDTNR